MRRIATLILAALAGPAAVLAIALIAWFAVGAAWALAALGAGWGAILVHHAVNLAQLIHWAESPLDARVPEGAGSWRSAFSALYQRARSRRAHERDLGHTIERFQSAAEAVPDGMVVLDAQNHLKWANLRAQALLGLDVAQDLGAPLVNLVRTPAFVRYLEVDDPRDGALIDSPRDAGVTLAVQIVPFGVAEKLLIARDVTQMETVARMRRDFIANVSHELKTPLTVISGFIETMQDLDLDERQRARFLELMREQSASMQRLVVDLLTLSALESEQNVLAEDPFPVGPLLDPSRRTRDSSRRGGTPSRWSWSAPRPSSAAARSSRARSAISCRTRSGTPRPVVRSGSRGAWMPTARASSRSRTPASGSTPSTSPGSPSASIASTGRARGQPAAPDSGWRSPRNW